MTCGSDNLREVFISDKRGKNVKEDRLFLNFYDYLMMIDRVITFDWFDPKIYMLEKHIRRKLRKFKDLPTANVFLQKVKEKDCDFCPVSYLSDEENYFEKIRRWKKDFENDYLERYPHSKKECWPVRYKVIYRNGKLIFLR